FEEWIKKDISNVKPISEEAKNYKGLVIHDQHCNPIGSHATTSDQKSLVIHGQHSRPIDYDAATSDHKGLRNTTEEKMELTKKRSTESHLDANGQLASNGVIRKMDGNTMPQTPIK
nr:transcription elongation factor, TFIIS/CRSP70 [Tanacetum cinerariifolium]